MKLKFKIPKKIAGYALLFAATLAFSGTALAGDYDGINPPSIIPTAYQDAHTSATKDKKAATDATNAAATANAISGTTSANATASAAAAATANKTAAESDKNLANNTKVLMAAGNFGTTGLFFGPTSGNSKVDAYGTLTSSAGLDKTGMDNFSANTGQGDKVHAYHAFGLAMTRLKDGAKKSNPNAIGFEDAVGGMEMMAKAFATFGIQMIKTFNPLPAVAALYDSSFLNNSAYTGQSGQPENQLISLINASPNLAGFIRMFGDPIAIGGVSVSMGYMITGVLIFLSLGYAAFSRLWNGQKAMITVRKGIVRFVIAAIGLPLVTVGGSHVLNWSSELLSSRAQTKEEAIISNNLNIYNWYKNASFGLPPGTTLTVKDGYFQFTPEVVAAINKWSSTNKTSSDGTAINITDPTNVMNIVAGNKIKPKQPKDLSEDAIAKGIISAGKTNNNVSKVTFNYSYDAGYVVIGQSGKGGNPWDTADIFTFAEALGGNKKYEPKDKNIVDNPYVKNAGLQAAKGANDISYNFTQSETQYGISPLAAFNLMATDFNESGFVVRTNTGDITTPTVAASIITASKDQKHAPGIVKLVMMFTMIGVGMKSLISIMTSGFGAVFRGGVGTTIGSAEGLGTLVGGVVALTLGIVGLSVIMTVAIELIDIFYAFIAKLLFSNEISQALDAVSDSILGGIRKWPVIGDIFSGMLKSITTFAMGIVALLMMPQVVKTPVVAYGEFVAGIPQTISERFARWEGKFTGDYHSGGMFGGRGGSSSGGSGGGGGGGGGGSAMSQMKEAEKAKRDARIGALKTGAGMMAAASLSRIGSRLAYGKSDSYKEGDDTENTNDTESSTQDTTKENTSEVEGAETFDDKKVDTSAIEAVENSENIVNPLEDPKDKDENNGEKGENSGEKTTTGGPNDKSNEGSQNPQKETPTGGAIKEPGAQELKDGENPPTNPEDSGDTPPLKDGEDTPHNGSETPLQDPQTSESGEPQTPEGDGGQGTETPEGGSDSTSTTENPNGSLTDPVDENGNSIDQSNSTENLNNEIKESSLNNANSDDSTEFKSNLEDNDLNQTGIEGASLVNQSSGDGKTGQTGKDGKSSENGGKETPAGSTPTEASKTPSVGQTPSGQPNSGKNGGGKNSGGKTGGGKNSGGKSGGKTGENSKRNQRLGKESANPPGGVRGFFSVAKKALGKGMMAAGGADHTRPLDKASTKGMFTAGLVHATAGLVGGQRFTARYAQNRIDNRNESIVASGGQVRSNLSAIGESRMEAQRRMESRLNTSRIGQDVQSQGDYHAQMLEQQRETTMILKQLAGQGAVKPETSSIDPDKSDE